MWISVLAQRKKKKKMGEGGERSSAPFEIEPEKETRRERAVRSHRKQGGEIRRRRGF
jgi:hypothetical protein